MAETFLMKSMFHIFKVNTRILHSATLQQVHFTTCPLSATIANHFEHKPLHEEFTSTHNLMLSCTQFSQLLINCVSWFRVSLLSHGPSLTELQTLRQTFLFQSSKTKRGGEIWQILREGGPAEECVTALTVALSSLGIKLRVLSLQEGLDWLTASSLLWFRLSVEASGFSTETCGRNTAHQSKELMSCFDHILHLEVKTAATLELFCLHYWH